ncbi:MAG: 4a-hydroxytetrahydrobiopterin dehydratase [Polyangiaceae bacterium]
MADQELLGSKCVPCEGGTAPIAENEIADLLRRIPLWSRCSDGPGIQRTFRFSDYLASISFITAVAWMAEREGHHPLVDLGYKQCTIRYYTHAINGLSQNDFICAAKVDDLFE